MPTATFYPSVCTQPGAGEGVFVNGVDSTDWTGISNASTDSGTTTAAGSLTNPNINGPNGGDVGPISVDREITVSGGSGTFVYGDTITQAGSGATGKFIYERGGKIFLKLISGVFTTTAGQTLSGGSATRGVPTLVRNAPPAPTDDRLATSFAYTNIALAATSVQSKMFRLGSWKRVGDDADLNTVITSSATSIDSLTLGLRVADSSFGVNSTGGSGACVYNINVQQRISIGAFGSQVTGVASYDFAAVTLYCYYNAINNNLNGTIPTVAQIRDATYALNGRLTISDSLETTQFYGFNGVQLTVTWTAPTSKPRRQIIRLPDGRIAAARARIR